MWYVFKDGRVRADLPVLECVSLLVRLAWNVHDRRTSYDFEREREQERKTEWEKEREKQRKQRKQQHRIRRVAHNSAWVQHEAQKPTQVSLLPAVAASSHFTHRVKSSHGGQGTAVHKHKWLDCVTLRKKPYLTHKNCTCIHFNFSPGNRSFCVALNELDWLEWIYTVGLLRQREKETSSVNDWEQKPSIKTAIRHGHFFVLNVYAWHLQRT